MEQIIDTVFNHKRTKFIMNVIAAIVIVAIVYAAVAVGQGGHHYTN